MAAAYGLYTHIQSNRRRSVALLIGLFFLVYVMVYAGALAAPAMQGEEQRQGEQRGVPPHRPGGEAPRLHQHLNEEEQIGKPPRRCSDQRQPPPSSPHLSSRPGPARLPS